MANLEDKDFYSVRITAEVLRVSRVTVFRYIKSGKLDAMKFKGNYYVCQSDLDMFVINRMTSQKFRDEARVIIGRLRDSVIRNQFQIASRKAPGISWPNVEG